MLILWVAKRRGLSVTANRKEGEKTKSVSRTTIQGPWLTSDEDALHVGNGIRHQSHPALPWGSAGACGHILSA